MADEANGRVTLAILQADIRHLTAEVGRLSDLLTRSCMAQAAQGDRILALETRREGILSDIEDLQDEVKTLRTRDMFGNVGASLLALAAGAIGWLKP